MSLLSRALAARVGPVTDIISGVQEVTDWPRLHGRQVASLMGVPGSGP